MWIVVLFLCALVAAIALMAMVALRVRIRVKGRGRFGDSWYLAAEIEVLQTTLVVAAAHATDPVLRLYLRNRLLWDHRPTPRKPPEIATGSRSRWHQWLSRHFDRSRLHRFAFSLRRYVRLASCQGHLTYATPDVAWTGITSGLLYALAGMAAPFGRFAVSPEWEAVLRAEGDIEMVVRLWLGRAIAATAWFAARNIRVRDQAGQGPTLPAQS